MLQLRMAAAASVLLTVAIPAFSQTTAENRSPAFPHAMQAPSQVSTATANPVEHQLTEEERGDLFMARKQYHEAMETYSQLAAENPRNAVYLNKLGIALHQQLDLGHALKCYERAMKLNPQYADAQNNIGTIWYQRKRYGKAIRAYLKAVKIRDDMPVLYSNLGYAYFEAGKYQESISAFRTALTKDPQLFEHSGSRNGSLLQDRSVNDRGKFYFLLAKSFAQAGNYERCILYLRKAKEEGYTSMGDVKKDPAFAAILKDPIVIDLLNPKVAETEQP